jgi:hypothetical protein
MVENKFAVCPQIGYEPQCVLKKREDFAISLRKAKKQEILKGKRRKLFESPETSGA